MLPTILFDFDGTVADTIEDIRDGVNFVLRNIGKKERTAEEITSFISNGIRHLIRLAVDDETFSEEQLATIQEDFLGYYQKHACDKTKPYDGIPELIAYLKKKGYTICVLSNKNGLVLYDICKILFGDVFSVVLGETEGVEKKPSCEMFRLLQKKLQDDSKNFIYIGDSDVDIAFAKNCEIECISVGWGYRTPAFLQEHGARKIVSSPEEIKEMLVRF